jgi:hypothetical protein
MSSSQARTWAGHLLVFSWKKNKKNYFEPGLVQKKFTKQLNRCSASMGGPKP